MDGLSLLYTFRPIFDEALYKQGNAHGWLAKSSAAASSNYYLAGRLYLAKSGWLLLSVPNALVRGVFDAVTAAGVELPRAGIFNVPNVDKELLNAHISVMTADEVAKIGADSITERGSAFHYSLGPVKELTPNNIDGISKIWAIQVSSPELAALRKSYGLSPTPKNEPFHITVAARRKGVLQENAVSKCYETSAETADGHSFRNISSRGELKAAASAETSYDCNCSGRCTCPDTCVCKKSGCCGHNKTAAADNPQPRVRVVLPYQGKYLLETLNNPKWPDNLGKRRFIGGGVENGETPAQAAARELFEELGVKVKPTAFRPLGNDPNKTHEHYLELAKHKLKPGVFKATVGSDPYITLTPGLPEGADYIGPDIKKLLAPVLKKAATDKLTGGAADNMPDSKFPKKDLATGAADEHEHTNNDQIAKEIAKDHLQEDPAYYKKEKLSKKEARSEIILKLREAKEHSDAKRYAKKNEILRTLMLDAPHEWAVDDPLPYHMGVTHTPTKFRFHADPTIIPVGVKVQAKAAAANPYVAQLMNTEQPIMIDKTKSLWQNFFNHLKQVKARGDAQLYAQQNDHAWRAALNPEYRQQMNLAIARGKFPQPSATTQLINRHGDSILSMLSK